MVKVKERTKQPLGLCYHLSQAAFTSTTNHKCMGERSKVHGGGGGGSKILPSTARIRTCMYTPIRVYPCTANPSTPPVLFTHSGKNARRCRTSNTLMKGEGQWILKPIQEGSMLSAFKGSKGHILPSMPSMIER